MLKSVLMAMACAAAMPAWSALPLVEGDAVQGLVSKSAKGEVHVIADAALNGRRLVLKIVVLNLSGGPQAFGPDAVRVTAGEAPVALATRDALIADLTGSGGADETPQAHATASMPVNSAGQTDVSGFTGGMGTVTGGVPASSVDRAQRRGDTQAIAALDAVLLKPMTIRANGADGGQVLTDKLKRSRTPEVTVHVQFAGEEHLFLVKVPR